MEPVLRSWCLVHWRTWEQVSHCAKEALIEKLTRFRLFKEFVLTFQNFNFNLVVDFVLETIESSVWKSSPMYASDRLFPTQARKVITRNWSTWNLAVALATHKPNDSVKRTNGDDDDATVKRKSSFAMCTCMNVSHPRPHSIDTISIRCRNSIQCKMWFFTPYTFHELSTLDSFRLLRPQPPTTTSLKGGLSAVKLETKKEEPYLLLWDDTKAFIFESVAVRLAFPWGGEGIFWWCKDNLKQDRLGGLNGKIHLSEAVENKTFSSRTRAGNDSYTRDTFASVRW